jgi:hypothetical protein
MLRHVLVGVSLMGVAGAASANPLPLSDQQLDTVIAGVIVGGTFERIAENGVLGFILTLRELDETTGAVTLRTIERSFPIPSPAIIPPPATIGFDISIGGGR